ncbi:hypothetical protein BASA81_005796 [Batrachochytrium salamandrivorans]|nr:hypothetical protein BASA81_005796 [Batrachochytrium salamandrivorans]
MEHVLAIEARPEFLQGQILLADKQLENAADVLGKLYEQIVDEEGDVGDGVAPIAYLYGEVNLGLAVASNNALMQANAKRLERERDLANGKPSSFPTAAAAAAEGPPPADQEDVDEMFSIAWDSLDLARVIYQRLECAPRQALAQQKLGELKLEQGLLSQSVEEVESCLDLIRQQKLEGTRVHALCHRILGLVYEAMWQDSQNQPQLLVSAVEHFAKSLAMLKQELGAATPTVPLPMPKWKLDVCAVEDLVRLGQAMGEVVEQLELVDEDEEELLDLKMLINDVSKRADQCAFEFTVDNVLPQDDEEEEEERVISTSASEPANMLRPRKRHNQG